MCHAPVLSLAVALVTVCHVCIGEWLSNSSLVRVNVTRKNLNRPPLEVVQASPVSGYIQTPKWDRRSLHPKNMNSGVRVGVPQHFTVMVTILHMDLPTLKNVCAKSVTFAMSQNSRVFWSCDKPIKRKLLAEGATLYVHFKCGGSQKSGFKLFFSVHNVSALLHRKSADLWNCSVSYFADYKSHFPCDLLPQCVNKEDERDCPYYSVECGLGFVTLGSQCLFYENGQDNWKMKASWRDAEFACNKRGWIMASFKTREVIDRVLHYLQPVIDVVGFVTFEVGIRSASKSLPRMYHHEFQHTDGTIAFGRWTYAQRPSYSSCGSFQFEKEHTSMNYVCLDFCAKKTRGLNVLCQIPKLSYTKNSHPIRIQLQSVSNVSIPYLALIGCPHGHVTRDFLACDFESMCWSHDVVSSCSAPLVPRIPSFTCANGREVISFTLVCDVRPDCSDNSDERFCKFPPCGQTDRFKCSDKECVPYSAVCNGQRNCYNSLDEDLCSSNLARYTDRLLPPAIVQLTRNGLFAVTAVKKSQLANPERLSLCPETHFQCPNGGYCMPVFLRCNGVYDCPEREDEAGCSSYKCPDFYRCRSSRICLHPKHLCDGIFQCPRNDDELLCDLTCPQNCTCYGLAFYCSQPFQARDFIKIRFLDCRSAGMKISDLSANTLLIHLNIASNELSTVYELNFPNLHFLDLSDNLLEEISIHELSRLPHLETLSLSGNPLLSLFQCTSNTNENNRISQSTGPSFELSGMVHITASQEVVYVDRKQLENNPEMLSNMSSSVTSGVKPALKHLRILDLSRVKNKVLNPDCLPLMPSLHTFNMSGGGVDTLLEEGLQALTQLRVLDLRGCPLSHFPRDIVRGLEKLKTVYADNYKLCCLVTLPVGFLLQNCHAPFDEVSSCEALLRTNSYRVFLSVFAFLSLLGNFCSFVYRVFMQKKNPLGFHVFVVHLCVADFFMGVYLTVIGVVDRLYQGTYMWEDVSWKRSPICSMAGFLSLVSSEVSALIICLITIDRFLVLRFPFSTLHFGIRGAHVVSLSAWGVGCLIAAFPLVPWVAHWQFYRQTGICIPLPIGRPDSPGYTYAFGVMIVANFFFFLVISAGQVSIYWSIRIGLMSSSYTSKKRQDLAMARRLITVAMSDFLCWFPIGLVGILAATGTPVSSEVSVAMAIFVLPFNSALNPFLYTLNILLEKQRKAAEERIKNRLMAQLNSLDTLDDTMKS